MFLKLRTLVTIGLLGKLSSTCSVFGLPAKLAIESKSGDGDRSEENLKGKTVQCLQQHLHYSDIIQTDFAG